MTNHPSCPYCGSAQTNANGYRTTRKGKQRRFLCKGCGRKFTVAPLKPGPDPIGDRPMTPAEKQAAYRKRHGLSGNEWRKKGGNRDCGIDGDIG